MSGLLIETVIDEGVAASIGVEPGDRLLSMNGHKLLDIIDYQYWNDGDCVTVEIEKPDGSVRQCEIEDGVLPGLMFHAPEPLHCRNKCIFCFVHQLPKGLRKPLYVKDEDYRLSFLYGNYVTLANLSKADLSRIKKLRLSPLYISVHATDPALRGELLGRKLPAPVLEIMKSLADAGITMHTQIVLCPGINDDDHLKKTVADLATLHPHVASVAIVPVGVTAHRKGLPHLTPVSPEFASSFILEWEPRIAELQKELGEPFIFLADEFYLKGDMPFPPVSSYGDFPQLENGVGMISLFMEESSKVLRKARRLQDGEALIVTGVSPLKTMESYLEKLSDLTGVSLRAVAVPNRLFGPAVTVTGLIAGRDIVSALNGVVKRGEVVVIPDVMLKEGEGVFLDDLTPGDLERELGARVVVAESSPAGLYNLLKREFRMKRISKK